MIEARFEGEMDPPLLQLKSRITTCSLNCVLRFLPCHSMRVHEFSKTREDSGAIRISVEELRETLGLKSSHERLADLRRHATYEVRRRVAEHTDIGVACEVEVGSSGTGGPPGGFGFLSIAVRGPIVGRKSAVVRKRLGRGAK